MEAPRTKAGVIPTVVGEAGGSVLTGLLLGAHKDIWGRWERVAEGEQTDLSNT